jgi:hypothetical protein
MHRCRGGRVRARCLRKSYGSAGPPPTDIATHSPAASRAASRKVRRTLATRPDTPSRFSNLVARGARRQRSCPTAAGAPLTERDVRLA